MPDLTGQSIGRYHIIAPLGEGGMAVVYKAFDTRLECEVAIKFIRKENVLPNQLEKMTARFEREAKRMAKFLHPNIIKVMDYGEYEGFPYLVMPYLPGGTLKEMLKARRGKPMPYQEAVHILLPLARALEYAHELDTIHRDVKPANILLTDKGFPMLTDFGVAKILDLDEGQTLTGTGVGVGTPKYMAPEQWQNHVSPQTDVYALGVVFYEMVTGRVPYDAETPAGVLTKQLTESLPRPRQFVPELPEEVEKVIFKALAKDAQQRYADMASFAQALERLAAHTPQIDAQRALTPAPLPQAVEGKKTVAQSQPQVGDGNLTTIEYGDGDQPSSSAKSAQSDKSAVQTSYVLGLIGLGLLAGIAMLFIFLKPSAEGSTITPTPSLSLQGEGQGEGTVETFPTITKTPIASETPLASETPMASATATMTEPPPMTNTPELQTRISDKDGMEQVYIPSGEFLMGSTDSDSEAEPWEKPQHKVYLDGYWMDKTEVTNAMYQKCMDGRSCEKPSCDYYSDSQKSNHPVVCVNWNQAQAYCKWAGGRLPSEAQWEKAARGTDGRKYPWGDQSPTCSLANIDGCGGDTKVVGSFADGASPYGIMDMSGNVWEWVNDRYGENYYQSSPQKNPTGPDSGTDRVLRGGSWGSESRYLRAAYRFRDSPNNWYYYHGFRCVGF